MVDQPRLPSIGKGRAKIGRHRRVLDALARDVRNNVGKLAMIEQRIVAARGAADEMDRLEADNDRSSHTFMLAARCYSDLTRLLEPYATQPDPPAAPADTAGQIGDFIAATLRNTPPP